METKGQQEPTVPGEASRSTPELCTIGIGIIVVLAAVCWSALARDSFVAVSRTALTWVLGNLDWVFVVVADVFLVLCVVLALGRYGRIRLGADDAEPEFSKLGWVALIFSAGMGIGLMAYGVGEPLQHYLAPPPYTGIAAQSSDAARTALQYSLFHWTLIPWAIYGVVGVALAYAGFRKGRGHRLSSVFVPLLGARGAAGWLGRAVDLLAVFATVFGAGTSLGLGALQIAKGMQITAGAPDSVAIPLIIIAALGSASVVSACYGLHRGIKWLSTVTMVLAAVLMLFVFVLGPTVYILESMPSSIGSYLFNLLPMATRTGAHADPVWLGSWTIFYWAWWLAWAPFVGTFLARISRGRTIREFLIGVLLIPSGIAIVWFCVMGGSAIRLTSTGIADPKGNVSDNDAPLFGILRALPGGTFASWLSIILMMAYFVTSASSASLVMGSFTSRGGSNTPRWLVVIWGGLLAAVAMVLLVTGGIGSLQTATILVAVPFVLVMLALCWSLLKELRADPGAPGPHTRDGSRDAVRIMVTGTNGAETAGAESRPAAVL